MSARQKGKPPYDVNLLDVHLPTSDEQRLYGQEMAIVAAVGAITDAIKAARISQAELARRIGKTPGFVSQVLSGTRNMTLRTLADFLWACGYELRDYKTCLLGQNLVEYDDMDAWLDAESTKRTVVEGKATPAKEGVATPAKEVPVRMESRPTRPAVAA